MIDLSVPDRIYGQCGGKLAVFLLLVWLPQLANAGWPCSINHAYPEVRVLAVVDGALRATLGDYFAINAKQDPGLMQYVLSENNTWAPVPSYEKLRDRSNNTRDNCMIAPLDTKWLAYTYGEPDRKNGFNQDIDVCSTHDNIEWGGIAFYGDEGGWGVGGVVRHDLSSGEYATYRPYGLREYTVSQIIEYDDQLWLGTTFNGECTGPQSGFGLKRYDPGEGDQYGLVRDVPEVCGFAMRGFAIHRGDLWVASELGLARARQSAGGELAWQNFVPDPSDERVMRPVSCDELYVELLRSDRFATDTSFDMGYAFEDFWGRLTELRPDFISRHTRKLHGHEPAIPIEY